MKTTKLILMGLILTWCSASSAHPPIPLSTPEAKAAIEQLTLSVDQQEKTINRLLDLEGDVAEQTLSAAQEVWFDGHYELAVKKLLALTMIPAISTHPAKAAIFQWLGLSYEKLGFNHLARNALLTSYTVVRQTDVTKNQTEGYLLQLPGALPVDITKGIWLKRRTKHEHSETLSPLYLVCRALFRSTALTEALSCFESLKEKTYDDARAAYFVGVIALKDRKYDVAKLAFQKALAIARHNLPEDTPTELETERETPGLEVAVGETEQTVDSTWPDFLIRTHLALGRLAASQQDWPRARRHYKNIPPGHPTYFEASRERALVFDRSARPREAAFALKAVGQAPTTSGPGLKQSMWRAELLGKGEDYDESQNTYDHIQQHTLDASRQLQGSASSPVSAEHKLRWLAPDLGLQFADLIGEIKRLEKVLKQLDSELKGASKFLATPLKIDSRTEEIAELKHRLKDISAGIDSIKPTHAMTLQLRKLEQRIARLKSRNEKLKAFHRQFSSELLHSLNEEAINANTEFRFVENGQSKAFLAIESAVVNLLSTLETQAGLGRLNMYVWRKEAVSRQLAQAIKTKQEIIKWVEAQDPGLKNPYRSSPLP